MENKIRCWYNEAIKHCREHSTAKENFIIYKGFKISCCVNSRLGVKFGFILRDVRKSDNYSDVSEKDLKELNDRGFIAGCDHLSYIRDNEAIKKLTLSVEMMYAKTKKAKKELPKNKRLNLKRIRCLKVNIDIVIDQMFIHKIRIEQFNSKYNLKES